MTAIATFKRALLVLVALVALAAPGAAQGSTLRLETGPAAPENTGETQVTLHYNAAPGEANDLRVTVNSGSATIDDPNATITATGAGCTASGPHQATCSTTPDAVRAELGDGANAARVIGATDSVELRGGDGPDTLDASETTVSGAGTALVFGGGGNDVLTGGGGFDIPVGRTGADELHGGPGDDVLEGGAGDGGRTSGEGEDAAPVSDLLDGGAGRDRADYGGRTSTITADLLNPDHVGAAGENDRLQSIEDLGSGGWRVNHLSGDDAPNAILGGSTSFGDVLEGRGGDDVLVGNGTLDGGAGNDRMEGGGRLLGGEGSDRLASPGGGTIDGGPGDDLLNAGHAREVACGGGADVMALRNQFGRPSLGSPIGPLMRDRCERLDVIGFLLDGPSSSGGRVLALARREVSITCGAAVEVRGVKGRSAGGLLGSARWRWPAAGRKALSIGLSRGGRRAAQLHRIVVAHTTSYRRCPRGRPISRAYRTGSLRFRL